MLKAIQPLLLLQNLISPLSTRTSGDSRGMFPSFDDEMTSTNLKAGTKVCLLTKLKKSDPKCLRFEHVMSLLNPARMLLTDFDLEFGAGIAVFVCS
jgi:hypothetical protein